MVTAVWVHWAEWGFLAYFLALHGGYLGLDLVATYGLMRYLREGGGQAMGRTHTGLEPPISILVPAYNEAQTITASVRALLQLEYPEYEILIINDGSVDGTLEALQLAFELRPFPEAYRRRLPCGEVHAVYRSRRHPRLRVLDKANGGKADALNAGINMARYPLFCSVDADSILQRDSLMRIVQPFLTEPDMVAAGGTIRIVNGCEVRQGFLVRAGLPGNPLALLQIAEYLRAFLFGRLGWSSLNGVLIISGAFGLFRKETVVSVGGYRTDTVGEDMELVVRLHRLLRRRGQRFRISFVPDPICWTEAPESLGVLYRQRSRWQRGLAESLSMNLGLLFSLRGGAAGWLAFPFMALFEWFGPLLEVAGYAFAFSGYLLGYLDSTALVAFLLVAVGLGVLLSVSALLLEELSFHVYQRPGQLAVLLMVVLLENFGYRQLNSFWRLLATLKWMFRMHAGWGSMPRTRGWHRED